MAIGHTILSSMLWLKMAAIKQTLWKPIIQKTQTPLRAQEALLKRIIEKNKDTEFGKEHRFSTLSSYADFKANVPVQSYEDLRPYIEKQEQDKTPSLNTTQPIMYAQTSGTTGKPKYIPILQDTVKQYRQSQHLFAYAEYEGISGVYDGKVLAIVSPAVEGHLETGTPYGSMSGLVYQSMPGFVHKKYVVPPEIFEISDYELKYYLIAAFALAENNITLIATANPSTLLKIDKVIKERFDELMKDIESGNEHGLTANPERAKELIALASGNQPLLFAKLWPTLKSVTMWTGGSCAVLIPSVRKLLSPSTKIVEMGYLSSEFRGSITVDLLHNKSIPTLHENFFEFVEPEAWEDEEPAFLTIDALTEGKQYYVFATTQNGLYRYFINDIVEVDGWFNKTPTIRFVQKGKGVTNLTGEKLYESQVIEAVQKLAKKVIIEIDFFMMLACPDMAQYTLYIESEPYIEAEPSNAVVAFEAYLGKLNIEFEAKRGSGRLCETQLAFLKPGTAEKYKQHCIEQGQREGQFKLVKLQYVKDCGFDFSPHRYERYENNQPNNRGIEPSI